MRYAISILIGVAIENVGDLIMDGNISNQFLKNWILTLDLARGRAWLMTVK